MQPRLQIVEGAVEWADAAAHAIAFTLAAALADRGAATWALSGGETPRAAYRRLTEPPHRDAVDWSRVELFFADERCVPPDDPRSNFRLVETTLIAALSKRPRLHRIPGELDPEEAARRYEAELRGAFNGSPVFDLISLGLGGDGHTASLFPGDKGLSERRRFAIATSGPATESTGPAVKRVTLTLPVLNAARSVMFLVTGAGKAKILARAMEEQARGVAEALPAARVRSSEGRLLWLVDDAAAAELPATSDPASPERADAGIE
jgi:6-phosphogluconolactonase